jgi:hypothetical protein
VEIETRKKKSRNPCGSPLIIKISTKWKKSDQLKVERATLLDAQSV